MWNLYMKNIHLFLFKPKSSSSHCYFTSNPISAADDGNDHYFSSDLAAVVASGRFFLSSPGRSKSIFDSSDASRHRSRDVVVSGLRVAKISVDPYGDFRRSMEEMIEGREMENNYNVRRERDWEYLRELLSSYLQLNPKESHKFIITAFADIVLCLLATSSPAAPPKTPR